MVLVEWDQGKKTRVKEITVGHGFDFCNDGCCQNMQSTYGWLGSHIFIYGQPINHLNIFYYFMIDLHIHFWFSRF